MQKDTERERERELGRRFPMWDYILDPAFHEKQKVEARLQRSVLITFYRMVAQTLA